MKSTKSIGLRGRLSVILLFAFLAVAGAMTWESFRDFDARLRHVSENLLSRVKLIVVREQALIARADATLDGLMLSSDLGPDTSSRDCAQALGRHLAKEPEFANIVRVRPNGDINCSAVPFSGSLNLSDRQWFHRALDASDLVIGDVAHSQILGKPVMPIAKTMHDDNGEVTAAYFLFMDLEWLQEELANARLPQEARLTVADSQGTIVFRYPDRQSWTGKSVADHPLFKQIVSRREEGILEEIGLSGETQLSAYAPLFTSDSGRAYHVWLSVPKDTVLAADARDLKLSLGIVLLVLTGTLGAVFWGGHRQVVRPLEIMSRMAAQFGAGDLDARSGLPHGDDLIGHLAKTLDETADVLQAKEKMLIENQLQLAGLIESLRESEERFRSVFQAAPHGMGVTDLDGKFRKGNPALCALVGFSPEELQSRWFQDIVHGDDRATDATGVQELLQGRTDIYEAEMRLSHRGGRVIWVQMSASLVHSSDGQPAYLLRQIQDISKQKQIALAEEKARLALVEAKEIAETANRTKSQFVAYMSHELRSPLNSLLILARLLAENRDGNLTPRQIGCAETIQEAGKEILGLINDVLDLAKLESGRATVHAQAVTFREVTNAIERIFRAQADSKGLKLVLSLDHDLPESLYTDTHYLLPILRNFVANAIKFTERGSVALSAYRANAGWKPDHPVLSKTRAVIAFEVRDTGIGIAEENLHRIFDAFEQVDQGSDSPYGGSGLGLHIALQNALLLGGEIRVSSVPGQGTAFTLYLPLNFAGPATLPAPAVESSPEPEKPVAAGALPAKTVLIVDDDNRNCLAQSELLGQHGLNVLVANNGQQAVDMVTSRPEIDIVLMDIMMPVMDGYEATLVLREKGFEDLPIIALTADARPSTRERCLAAGCSDYLTKPVDKNLLLARLEHWLELTA